MSMAPTRLLPAEHKRVFDEVIVPQSGIDELKAVDPPKAIILAGQPGAGKGGLANQALKDLDQNAVVIDTDAYRDAHPDVAEFRKQHPYNWSDDTHPDASAWAKELRQKAIDEGKNIVIDTTLGDGKGATDLIKHLKEKGYEVEVRAIATTSIESELGVDQRFTGSLERNGFGRFVPEQVRSDIYKALPGNLDIVQKETGVPISIFDRQGEKLYDGSDGRTAGQALIEERANRFESPDVLLGASKGWEAQQTLHKGLPESLKENEKIDADTAKNLLAEREQHGVVALVDRFTDATRRYLHDVQPPTEQPSMAASSQQIDSAMPQMGNDSAPRQAKL
jgi:nucleotide-binding universal stress UspA family protein